MPVRLANQTEPIPGYKLLERLGRGGFGEVWKAEAPGGLLKAIKFVFGDLESTTDKGGGAEQEFKALNRVKTVRHPFILSLERVDVIDGQLVIVMELADRNLMDRFREAHSQGLPGVPREELLRYMEEAAEALDLMNTEYQLQHLDIKPQNLFLVRNHVKVADFGLVKDMQGMSASVTGGVTPLYAAPETFEGRVSRYCDQYSLAIVYQELLTGVRPFDGANARQLLLQHVQMAPDVSALPEEDQPHIARALSKKAEDRFPTCTDLIAALRAAGQREAAGRVKDAPAPVVSPTRAQVERASKSDAPDASISNTANATTKNIVSPRPPAQEIMRTPRPGAAHIARTPRPLVPEAPAEVSNTRHGPLHISAPVEFRGNGVLLPALVIGIGQMGLGVLQRLRETLAERFGTLESLPHFRLLYIDTDPDGIGAALRGTAAAALQPSEVMLARLNRPSHYIKPRDVHTSGGAPAISTWLNPQILYRIPRNQLTGGVRALGRLALMDNYRDVSDRIKTALAACTEAEALATADRHTKLGLRINRPRVYVAAHLGGGTGSGMFLDVAYTVREHLKQIGYPPSDVVGMFFLPNVEMGGARAVDLGNAYAALTELNHFCTPGVSFTARYDAKAPPTIDPEGPFGRCILLEPQSDEETTHEAVGLGASFLLRDLFTPLGRTIDARRTEVSAGKRAGAAAKGLPALQTFGMYRLSWPRRALIQRAARAVGLRLIEHWLSKDSARLRGHVQSWARDQFLKRGMQADRLIASLKAAGESVLDQEPEDAFDQVLEQLGKPGTYPEPRMVQHVMDQLEQMVGRPEGLPPLPERPSLMEGLDQAAKTLLQNCEQKLAEMAVHLVEQPKYRFAGAEEAIRQISTIITEIIGQQEPLCNEFIQKASVAHERITKMTETLKAFPPGGKRRIPPEDIQMLNQLLRLYPTVRYQSLVLQRVLTVYRSLLGNCPEYQREFTYCRTRLTDLLKAFSRPPDATQMLDLGPGRHLFAPGCRSLDDAVAAMLKTVTQDELVDLDTRVQTAIQNTFKALVHVCTTAANNIIREVEAVILQELEQAIKTRLGNNNIVDTFLSQSRGSGGAGGEIASAFDEATPKLTAGPITSGEVVSVIVVPGDPAAEQFKQLARKAVPEAELIAGLRGDDIIFYKELPFLPLAKLPHVGAEARQAYEKMNATDTLTPHCRTDIADWRKIVG